MEKPPVPPQPAAMCRLLYDTGPTPLFVRIMTLPFAVLGIVVLYRIFQDGALRVGNARTVLGFAATALLVLSFVQLWFWRSSILFDREQQALVQRHRGLFGLSEKRTMAREVTQLVVRPGRIRASRFWDLQLVLSSGRRSWLLRLHDEPQAHALARVLAEVLRLDKIDKD